MDVTQHVQEVVSGAFEYAEVHKHRFIMPEHLLLVALDNEIVIHIMESCKADVKRLRNNVAHFLDTEVLLVKDLSMQAMQTIGFKNVMEHAIEQAHNADKPLLDITDILVSIYEQPNSYGAYFMRKSGITRLALMRAITSTLADCDDEDFEPAGMIISTTQKDLVEDLDSAELEETVLQDGLNDSDEKSGKSQNVDGAGERTAPHRTTILERYTVNLTAAAQHGELDPVIGRDDVLNRTIEILCRRTKNNPVHVGDPGVGKTAITSGLAQRIVSGDVPEMLKDTIIYSLDLGALIAGTKFRGDFEDRIKKLIDEISQKPKTVLFIDEIHMLVGAGSGNTDAFDASNLLKPALASGKLRCIGTTTYEEFATKFEKDRALVRRFQKIDITEPDTEQSVLILQGLKHRYELFHNVSYTDEAIAEAVRLSRQFIIDRRLPDKAIDVLDESGSFAKLHLTAQNKPPYIVDTNLIEQTIAKMAKIPQATVTLTEKSQLAALESHLRSTIYGQDMAISLVCTAVKRSRAGFRSPDKPVASFLFAGPTGVGKTELAKQLATALRIPLHRFDMSEYQEKYTVSKLIGSPPGYVGFEDGGLLIDTVRKQPYAVVLLDEIEKAHSDVYNVLLQIMDYATLTDNKNRKADFRNIILIMTSNAGAREIGKPMIGFGNKTIDNTAITDAVERIFAPEFRSRLDAVVPFNHLSRECTESIVRRELDRVTAVLAEKNVTFTLSEACINQLTDDCYDPALGARNTAKIIDEKIASFFVDEVLFGSLVNGGNARADLQNGKIVIETVDVKETIHV